MSADVPKPEGSLWTNDQWAAITMRGSNLLVAAAAGSGKTAVLVERIIKRITDETEPIDVDRLLVATFTNAAAAEMRERIREALEKELLTKPDSDHLRKQIALMNRSQITTLHSFCLDVIRRYSQSIRLDPGFRMAGETEAQLLRLEVLEELFEHNYAASGEGSEFWQLVEQYGGERSDDDLYRLVQQLYDQSRSLPWPDQWLRDMASQFQINPDEASETGSLWTGSLLLDVRLELQGIAELLGQALIIADSPGGPAPYSANLQDDLAQINQVLDVINHDWDRVREAIQSVSFGRLNPCRGDQFDKIMQDDVKELRNAAKDQMGKLQNDLFTRTTEQYFRELADLAPVVDKLVDLTIQFGEQYLAAKTRKSLLDFADLEHYCLQVLRDPASTPQLAVPSSAALDYQQQFVEILLDEYQDTNQVQEAIIELISRGGQGNRFMVGDVKQSIYRFRLADPGLFLRKYRNYSDRSEKGQKIDLARNFRSRREIVDGVNFIFKQVMNEEVGEIVYDKNAELTLGAKDFPELPMNALFNHALELTLLEKTSVSDPGESAEFALSDYDPDNLLTDSGEETLHPPFTEDLQEIETVRLESRYITAEIVRLMGQGGIAESGFSIYDKKTRSMRMTTYRDIVILLRATKQWAPIMIEELKLAGIPAYAELDTGYFDASEIQVMLALLNLIDNPYQDIPLAAVLRSPIVGLSAEELSQIRIHARNMPFYEALLNYVNASGDSDFDENLRERLTFFMKRLDQWRSDSRQGALADLIWRLYGETGYFDFVGGLPGGIQRQANLRALYDRARQYEATSYRGLFRFLRFIERMKDSGGDLGTAKALSEQENVVRIMSIHKSKGLEFPVVFVAGIAKQFNRQDLYGNFLIHKELGFGPKYVDSVMRFSYPSLPALAIRSRIRMEMLAEEMRVLYVALTRAREKIYLVGTVKSLEKKISAWGRHLQHPDPLLPPSVLAKAVSFLDWIGPAIMRHPHAGALRMEADVLDSTPAWVTDDPSSWKVNTPSLDLFMQQAEVAAGSALQREDGRRGDDLAHLRPMLGQVTAASGQISKILSWEDPLAELSSYFAKTSVSEIKRMTERQRIANDEYTGSSLTENFPATGEPSPKFEFSKSLLRRPRFLEKHKLTPAERGIVFHAVMQHIPLGAGEVTEHTVIETVQSMVDMQLLTEPQAEVLEPETICRFFRSEVGQRLLRAEQVYREVPFSYALSTGEVYGVSDPSIKNESVLIQGVIDCLFRESGRLVLLDFKTDTVREGNLEELSQRYKLQIDLYARAVADIWKQPVDGKYVYFFDGGHVIAM